MNRDIDTFIDHGMIEGIMQQAKVYRHVYSETLL